MNTKTPSSKLPPKKNSGNSVGKGGFTKTPQRLVRIKKFVEAYVENGGYGAKAAITAGYSPKSASNTATAMLRDPLVKKVLAERKAQFEAELKAKHGLTIESVLREVRRIALGDIRKLYNPDGTMKAIKDLDDDTAAMIASIDQEVLFGPDKLAIGALKKIKLFDKNSALDKAMKHLGLYETDNKQKPVSINISIDDSGVL